MNLEEKEEKKTFYCTCDLPKKNCSCKKQNNIQNNDKNIQQQDLKDDEFKNNNIKKAENETKSKLIDKEEEDIMNEFEIKLNDMKQTENNIPEEIKKISNIEFEISDVEHFNVTADNITNQFDVFYFNNNQTYPFIKYKEQFRIFLLAPDKDFLENLPFQNFNYYKINIPKDLTHFIFCYAYAKDFDEQNKGETKEKNIIKTENNIQNDIENIKNIELQNEDEEGVTFKITTKTNEEEVIRPLYFKSDTSETYPYIKYKNAYIFAYNNVGDVDYHNNIPFKDGIPIKIEKKETDDNNEITFFYMLSEQLNENEMKGGFKKRKTNRRKSKTLKKKRTKTLKKKRKTNKKKRRRRKTNKK
jgi:hypothetical protein